MNAQNQKTKSLSSAVGKLCRDRRTNYCGKYCIWWLPKWVPRTASVVQIQSQEIVPIWGHYNFMEHIKEVKFWQRERERKKLLLCGPMSIPRSKECLDNYELASLAGGKTSYWNEQVESKNLDYGKNWGSSKGLGPWGRLHVRSAICQCCPQGRLRWRQEDQLGNHGKIVQMGKEIKVKFG